MSPWGGKKTGAATVPSIQVGEPGTSFVINLARG